MKNNWIYENSASNYYRYLLGEKGDNPLICFGVNPSTATPYDLDPTIVQIRNRAKQLGHDGWMMINLYPQRATDRNCLHSAAKKELVWSNFTAIRQYVGILCKCHLMKTSKPVRIQRKRTKGETQVLKTYFSKNNHVDNQDIPGAEAAR